MHSRTLARLAVVAALLGASSAASANVAVPPHLQAQLVAKVARYERTFAERVGPEVNILIVKASGAESGRVGAQLEAALGKVPDIGGTPLKVTSVAWSGGGALKGKVEADKIDIVYLSADVDAKAAAGALSGVAVLTVAAEPTSCSCGVASAMKAKRRDRLLSSSSTSSTGNSRATWLA